MSSQDQPSLQNKFDVPVPLKLLLQMSTDEAQKTLFNAAKVRDVKWCQECCKSRCIYSKGKLTFTERMYMQDIKDSPLFTLYFH